MANPPSQPLSPDFASLEVDRFEHVPGGRELALLRLEGRYRSRLARPLMEAALLVDDGLAIHRHEPLPQSTLLEAGLGDDDWLWRAAFAISVAALEDPETAFVLEAGPGLSIELADPDAWRAPVSPRTRGRSAPSPSDAVPRPPRCSAPSRSRRRSALPTPRSQLRPPTAASRQGLLRCERPPFEHLAPRRLRGHPAPVAGDPRGGLVRNSRPGDGHNRPREPGRPAPANGPVAGGGRTSTTPAGTQAIRRTRPAAEAPPPPPQPPVAPPVARAGAAGAPLQRDARQLRLRVLLPARSRGRRAQLRHREVPRADLPAADLPGRGHPVRHPLGGPGRDQRDRDRLRPQPERLDRRRAGLDAVHAGDVGHLRRRRQPRRQARPVQPRRRDLRRRALPQGRGRRQGHQEGHLRLQPRRLVRRLGHAPRAADRRRPGRPRRLAHRPHRGPLPRRRARTLRRQPRHEEGRPPRQEGPERRQRHPGQRQAPPDLDLLQRARPRDRGQRRRGQEGGAQRAPSAATWCSRTSTATATRTPASARSSATTRCRRGTPAAAASAPRRSPPTPARTARTPRS